MTPWLVLSPAEPHRCDGIGDYAWLLSQALTGRGMLSDLVVRTAGESTPVLHAVPSWRALRAPEWRDRASTSAGVIVQYMPQAFAQSDFPALLRWLALFTNPARPVMLTLHEFWVPPNGRARRAVVHAIHRRMLSMLIQRASRIAVTTDLAGRLLDDAGLLGGRRVRTIPVGSSAERVVGTPASEPTLVMFGQPASFHAPTLRALGVWLSHTSRPVRLLWLGGDPEQSRRTWTETLGLRPDRVQFLGGLAAAEVSSLIGSAHVALGPYVDGVATRRSSLATMLAHALPVVGLDGICTDARLRNSGAFLLNDPDPPDDFIKHIELLLDNPDRRGQMATAAARLTHTLLSWDRIAEAYAELAQSPDHQ